MNIGDYISIAVIALIIFSAVFYIVKEKKKGTKCIGCPHSKSCKTCSCHTSVQNGESAK